MRKREFYCSKFSCLTKKKFIFSIKSKHKKNHNEYYMIFKIQNFNFGTLANQRMSYQEDLIKKTLQSHQTERRSDQKDK